MRVIPIKLKNRSIHIRAEPRLAFQVLSAFGAKTSDGSSSKVLVDSGNTKLVRFTTPLKLLVRKRELITEETVKLNEPHRIDFELKKGYGIMSPMKLLEESFVLETEGKCTKLTYSSCFGIMGAYLGWIVGKTVVQGIMSKFMIAHLNEIKETIEARAIRSKVYPMPPKCSLD